MSGGGGRCLVEVGGVWRRWEVCGKGVRCLVEGNGWWRGRMGWRWWVEDVVVEVGCVCSGGG